MYGVWPRQWATSSLAFGISPLRRALSRALSRGTFAVGRGFEGKSSQTDCSMDSDPLKEAPS